MSLEKKAREALERHGAKDQAKKAGTDFDNTLAQAADDVGRISGKKEDAERFVENAARVLGKTAKKDREMRRPDLFPQYDTDPNRKPTGQVGPKSKLYFYPGKRR
jgi:hypothetical protein